MRVLNGVRTLTPSSGAVGPGSSITIGNFDGMHVGHQALMGRVKARAAATPGAKSIVMTFDPHPLQILAPEKHLKRIFDLDDQIDELTALNLDMLVVEPFSREFSQLAPERFLREWVVQPFRPASIVVGYDFSFGAGRQGSIAFLEAQAAQLGFELEVVPPVQVDGANVSSSRIRQAITAGDVALAARLLGRRFYIKGLVEKGAGRGRKIGIPTANLRTFAETVPGRGVYAAWAELHGQRWKAAVNIGLNPTFTEGHAPITTIEAHVLGFPIETDLYGENLRLDFVARLREEKKFSGVDALIAQIREDLRTCDQLLDASAEVRR